MGETSADFGSATFLTAHDYTNNNGVSETPSDTHQNIRIDFARAADAGACFVLQSKGNWWHAGFHLTTAIVGPAILTLPFAFRGMGWALGVMVLSIEGAVTFYSYFLMSLVLDHCERQGRRHIRFRELASDILGPSWMYYLVVSVQTIINMGIGIACILLAAECMQLMYSNMQPDGSLKLYHFVIMVSVVLILLSQLPSFHSLRYLSLASLILSMGYSVCVVIACVFAGHSQDAPAREYSLVGTRVTTRIFNAFISISIIGSIFGNGILPEIQATLAPPATGKMFKGLCMCYGVILLTFYSVAVAGYWAFGNRAQANILKSLLPEKGPALAPKWLLAISVIFVLLQLIVIGMVYSQVIYEIMERRYADVQRGVFSVRNVLPRMILRSLYIVICAVFAAMLPFFGDINAIAGAVGFIPLDFVLPMLLYNKSLKPSRGSFTFWINVLIMVVFAGVGIMGTISSVRQLCLDSGSFKIFSGKDFD